jgi:hypothetical protein
MSSKVIHVGDKVQIRLAGRAFVGQVQEDRGPIGVGGRRLYGIVYELGKDNRYYIELPADEIQVVEPKKETA